MGYFFGLLLGYIVSGLIFGFVTAHIAESKGYNGGFAWGFWLGLIGVLVVGFRPTITQPQEYIPMYGGALSSSNEKLPSWTCTCGSKNPGRLDYCPVCRRTKGESVKGADRKCPFCGTMNNISRTECVLCNHPLDESKSTEISNQPKTNTVPAKNGTDNNIELLEKLATLHSQGILTDEEFQQKKADILSKL